MRRVWVSSTKKKIYTMSMFTSSKWNRTKTQTQKIVDAESDVAEARQYDQ